MNLLFWDITGIKTHESHDLKYVFVRQTLSAGHGFCLRQEHLADLGHHRHHFTFSPYAPPSLQTGTGFISGVIVVPEGWDNSFGWFDYRTVLNTLVLPFDKVLYDVMWSQLENQ